MLVAVAVLATGTATGFSEAHAATVVRIVRRGTNRTKFIPEISQLAVECVTGGCLDRTLDRLDCRSLVVLRSRNSTEIR